MSDSKDNSDAHVLHWSGKLFSSEDLRRHWKNQRELVLLPRTLLTPLALDELRAKGVRVTRQETTGNGPRHPRENAGRGWGYLQEIAEPAVAAAAVTLEREGIALTAISPDCNSPATRIGSVGAWVNKNAGAVMFCTDAALDCYLANKEVGLRAAVVSSAMQTGRALGTLGANLIVVEVPGRTFFEIRQILRTVAAAGLPACPPEVARFLLEIEGHAHR